MEIVISKCFNNSSSNIFKELLSLLCSVLPGRKCTLGGNGLYLKPLQCQGTPTQLLHNEGLKVAGSLRLTLLPL